MNRIELPYVIVVEGTTDQALIASFCQCEIVTTNGSEVSRETIDYLKKIRKTKDIVVLTDPDSPGKRIRDILDQEIPGLLHAYIPKEKAIKKKKVGVAESDKETILEALSHLIPSSTSQNKGNLTMNDLFECGLTGRSDSSANRESLMKRLHLGHGNAKTLLKRLNALGYDRKKLEEALDGRE